MVIVLLTAYHWFSIILFIFGNNVEKMNASNATNVTIISLKHDEMNIVDKFVIYYLEIRSFLFQHFDSEFIKCWLIII